MTSSYVGNSASFQAAWGGDLSSSVLAVWDLGSVPCLGDIPGGGVGFTLTGITSSM